MGECQKLVIPTCNINVLFTSSIPPLTTFIIPSYSMIGNGLYSDSSLSLNTGVWSVPFTCIYKVKIEASGVFSSSPDNNLSVILMTTGDVIYKEAPMLLTYSGGEASFVTSLLLDKQTQFVVAIKNNSNSIFTVVNGRLNINSIN